MSAHVISGKELSKDVRSALKEEVVEVTAMLGRSPGLAVVLVGEDPASQVYVASKSKQARACGIEVVDEKLSAETTDEQLQELLKNVCARPGIDGVLLQLPLPAGLDEFGALCSIDASHDADGLHPFNQGLLLRGAEVLQPCTPKGCVELILKGRSLLGESDNLSGLHAVVVGRSILVGKPMGLLLLDRNCTVTYCHSRTKNLDEECRRADILIAAVGRPGLINASAVKPGAIIIDVGINRTEEGKLVGDVEFDEVCKVAGAVTPVPGGVGPMTIAMLLKNTVEAAKRKIVE